jgi:hypothetical protein
LARLEPPACRTDAGRNASVSFLACIASPCEIRIMRVVAVIGALACSFGSAGTARADGLTDLLGPREIAVGDAARGGATGSAARSNPAGLPLSSELVFEGGFGYRGIDSTSVVGVSACDSTNAAPGCFYYDYLSSSDAGGMQLSRKAHVVGGTLARMLTPRVIIGAGVKYFRFSSEMPGDTSAKGFTYDLGGTVRLTETINLGVVGYNLFGDTSTQFPRAFAVGAKTRPIPALTASFDALWNLDREGKNGRYGGGLEYFVSSNDKGYPIRIGGLHDVSTDATYVSGGIGLATLKLGLDIGGRRQVKGGDEMTIVASLRFFGPRQAAPALR